MFLLVIPEQNCNGIPIAIPYQQITKHDYHILNENR